MISVIVPVYNGARSLPGCIRSVLNQTEADWELLLINDGSRDNTAALCRKAAARDRRIRFFSQENLGVSAARNRGLVCAGGEFVTFLDADDLLTPTALETLKAAMEAGADFVIGSHRYFRLLWKRDRILCPENRVDALVSLMCGKLYRRDILTANQIRFRETLPYGEDTVFNLQYGSCAGNWKVLPDMVCLCRMGGRASSLRGYPNRGEIALSLVKAYEAYTDGKGLSAIAQQELAETILHDLVHYPAEASRKAEEAKQLLSPYLPKDCETVTNIRKKHRKRILLRRLKKYILGWIS